MKKNTLYNIMPGVELLAICLHILALEATQPPSPALKVNAVASKKFNCNLQGGNLKERLLHAACQEYILQANNERKGIFKLYSDLATNSPIFSVLCCGKIGE